MDKYYIFNDDGNKVCGGFLHFLNGFDTEDEAESAMNELIDAGRLDEDCYIGQNE